MTACSGCIDPYVRRISGDGNAILTEASWFGARAFRESARSEYCRTGGGFCVAAIAWSVLNTKDPLTITLTIVVAILEFD
jgi:hypothetical protein